MKWSRQRAAARRYRFSRWSVCGYSLALILFGGGLVQLWPKWDKSGVPRRVWADTQVRFVGTPGAGMPSDDLLLAFMRHPAALATPSEPAVTPDDVRPLEPHPRFLDVSDAVPKPAAPAPAMALPRQAAGRMRGYVPVWADVDPFVSPPAFRLQYVVEPSQDLAGGGFTIPEERLQAIDGGDQPWDLTVDIVCDDDGKARDVVALSEGTHGAPQSNVVRLLQQAGTKAGTGCRGRLTVRWARVPVTADGT